MTTPQPTQQDPQPTPVTTIPTDDDLDDVTLGKACSIDNPECESCQ